MTDTMDKVAERERNDRRRAAPSLLLTTAHNTDKTRSRNSELFTRETYSMLQGDTESQEVPQRLRDLQKGLDERGLHFTCESDDEEEQADQTEYFDGEDDDDSAELDTPRKAPTKASKASLPDPPHRVTKQRASLLTDFYRGDQVHYPQLPKIQEYDRYLALNSA
jgi:hypothetical protein